MGDMGDGTKNTPTKFAGEKQARESFQVLRKPGSEFKILFTPNETNEREFSKKHNWKENRMNIYTIGSKHNIFRSTAEKKETWSYDRF